MQNKRIIPLLFLDYRQCEGVHLFFSTIGITVNNIDLSPNYDYNRITGISFEPKLISYSGVSLSFDPFNPDISLFSIKITLDNELRLQDYEYYQSLTSDPIVGIFILYDLINKETVFRFIGKMTNITYTKETYKFTLLDLSRAIFIDQPERVLKEDTFQTVHTFGPFNENPLSMFGLLVDMNPGEDKRCTYAAVPTWPFLAVHNDDDSPRSICTFIEHPSLYNEDDDYWIGALVSIIEDPLPVGNYVERAGYDTFGNVIPDSPYRGWPSSFWGENAPLLSKFCLGASAYVLPNVEGRNATFGSTKDPMTGRIWFDPAAREINWEDPLDNNRILPFADDLEVVTYNAGKHAPLRDRYNNRTVGAIAMGNIAQRHVIRIFRRALPENIDSVGMFIPIAYGCIKRGLTVHAIGGKAIGDEGGAGNDYYIICGHKMCHRIVLRFRDQMQGYTTYLDKTVQFEDIKIWHSEDEFTEKAVKDTNPYLRNKNEYGEGSHNPFPRFGNKRIFDVSINDWDEITMKEPCVMWFNAGEDYGYRYPPNDEEENRQIVLIDNYNNPKTSKEYSGIRLRGDTYWKDFAYTRLHVGLDDLVDKYFSHDNYWLRNGLGSSKVYVDFNGHPDFDDGILTGIPICGVPIAPYSGINPVEERENPAGLLTHPLDIMVHFLLTYTRLNGDRSKIDWSSYRKAKGMLFNWKFSSFISESAKGEDILSRWQKQCRTKIYMRDGRFHFRYIDLSVNRKISYLFNESTIERGSFMINKKGNDIFNKFVIKYRYFRPQDTWENSITYDATNNRFCANAQAVYNASDSFEFECPDIREFYVAKWLADYFVELYTRPRIQLKFKTLVNDSIANIDVGDLVVVQHSDLPNYTRFSRNKSIVYNDKMFFLVTNINMDKDLYSFELLQLFDHNSYL